jgi:hypothetical protein
MKTQLSCFLLIPTSVGYFAFYKFEPLAPTNVFSIPDK